MLYELYCFWKCFGLITGKNWLKNGLEMFYNYAEPIVCIIVFLGS